MCDSTRPPVEAWSLALDGYRMTSAIVEDTPRIGDLVKNRARANEDAWNFGVLGPELRNPSPTFMRHLRGARKRFFKPSALVRGLEHAPKILAWLLLAARCWLARGADPAGQPRVRRRLAARGMLVRVTTTLRLWTLAALAAAAAGCGGLTPSGPTGELSYLATPTLREYDRAVYERYLEEHGEPVALGLQGGFTPDLPRDFCSVPSPRPDLAYSEGSLMENPACRSIASAYVEVPVARLPSDAGASYVYLVIARESLKREAVAYYTRFILERQVELAAEGGVDPLSEREHGEARAVLEAAIPGSAGAG
jgi:hypothetical protein